MAKYNLNDLLGVALLLVGVFIFYQSLFVPSNLIKFVGLVGSTILMIVEAVFLIKTWMK